MAEPQDTTLSGTPPEEASPWAKLLSTLPSALVEVGLPLLASKAFSPYSPYRGALAANAAKKLISWGSTPFAQQAQQTAEAQQSSRQFQEQLGQAAILNPAQWETSPTALEGYTQAIHPVSRAPLYVKKHTITEDLADIPGMVQTAPSPSGGGGMPLPSAASPSPLSLAPPSQQPVGPARPAKTVLLKSLALNYQRLADTYTTAIGTPQAVGSIPKILSDMANLRDKILKIQGMPDTLTAQELLNKLEPIKTFPGGSIPFQGTQQGEQLPLAAAEKTPEEEALTRARTQLVGTQTGEAAARTEEARYNMASQLYGTAYMQWLQSGQQGPAPQLQDFLTRPAAGGGALAPAAPPAFPTSAPYPPPAPPLPSSSAEEWGASPPSQRQQKAEESPLSSPTPLHFIPSLDAKGHLTWKGQPPLYPAQPTDEPVTVQQAKDVTALTKQYQKEKAAYTAIKNDFDLAKEQAVASLGFKEIKANPQSQIDLMDVFNRAAQGYDPNLSKRGFTTKQLDMIRAAQAGPDKLWMFLSGEGWMTGKNLTDQGVKNILSAYLNIYRASVSRLNEIDHDYLSQGKTRKFTEKGARQWILGQEEGKAPPPSAAMEIPPFSSYLGPDPKTGYHRWQTPEGKTFVESPAPSAPPPAGAPVLPAGVPPGSTYLGTDKTGRKWWKSPAGTPFVRE